MKDRVSSMRESKSLTLEEFRESLRAQPPSATRDAVLKAVEQAIADPVANEAEFRDALAALNRDAEERGLAMLLCATCGAPRADWPIVGGACSCCGERAS